MLSTKHQLTQYTSIYSIPQSTFITTDEKLNEWSESIVIPVQYYPFSNCFEKRRMEKGY